MKEIKAIIRPRRLDATLEALHTHPELPGVTVSEVRGFGRSVGRQPAPGATISFGTCEMAKLECVVNDEHVEMVIDLIRQAAHTGHAGDGKIFVYDLVQAVKVRTGAHLERIE